MVKIKELLIEETVVLENLFDKIVYLLGWFFIGVLLTGFAYIILGGFI